MPFRTLPYPVATSGRFNAAAQGQVLRAGMVVMADHSASGDERATTVSQPDIRHMHRPAFIVHPSSDGMTNGMKVKLIPADDMSIAVVEAWTDQNITQGDILGPQPGSHVFRRGALFTTWGLRALESVDRSSSPGLVACDVIPSIDRFEYALRHNVLVEDWDDRVSFTVTDSGSAAHTQFERGWNALAPSGTVAVDSAGGFVGLTPQNNADNAAASLFRGATAVAAQPWVIRPGCPLFFDARVVPKEHNTDDANFHVGLIGTATISSTVPMGDNGAGPPADYDGVNFHKLDNGTVWLAETANSAGAGSKQTTAGVGSLTTHAPYRLQFLYNGSGGITFFINGVAVAAHSSVLPVQDSVMTPCFSVKNGSANNGAAVLEVSYLAIRRAKDAAGL